MKIRQTAVAGLIAASTLLAAPPANAVPVTVPAATCAALKQPVNDLMFAQVNMNNALQYPGENSAALLATARKALLTAAAAIKAGTTNQTLLGQVAQIVKEAKRKKPDRTKVRDLAWSIQDSIRAGKC